ncbi:MAG: hypothetical protein JWM36_2957 [Hyphomicrobiales bacterium]|nr:hypothetical protein [Hyphomicrobiales bacterium]
MREILTILASALILVLTAALVGPWFVDWTAQRGWVETELSRLSGAHVQVGGPISLQLLPVPRLELASVHVSSIRADGPALEIRRLRFELAVASLIRGELRFTEAMLDRPQLSIARAADGAIVLPRMPNFKPSDVQIERMSVTDGALTLRGVAGGPPLVIGGLDFLGDAGSLAGPYKGAGQIRLGEAAAKYRFSTGTVEGDRIRVKAILDEGPLTPRGDLDGTLMLSSAAGGTRLSYEGAAGFSATSIISGAAVPWRLSGNLKIDPSQAVLDPAEVRAGDEDRALAASGTAQVSFGKGAQASLTLTARQLDFDRLLADQANVAASGARLAAIIGTALADPALGARFPWPVTLSLTSPTAALAGETLTDVRAELGLASGKPALLKGAAIGPARSRLVLDGAVETGSAAAFRGKVEFGARDVPRFSDWLTLSAPDLAARLRGLPFRSIDVAGDVEASAGGVMGRNLVIQADRSELAGTMAFTQAVGSERARLFADLTSEALDLDSIPELAGPARLAADMDLSLAFEARAVRLARFGEGVVDAGRIGLKVVKTGDKLALERFAVDNLGGASLSASGGIEGNVATLVAKLDASRLGDLADLLRRTAPGPYADALARRSTALSPARLAVSAHGKVGAVGIELQDLRIEGTARGTQIATNLQPTANAFDFSATLENPDTPMLLRQIGIETLPLTGLGPARMQVTAKGSAAAGFEARLDVNAARSDMSFEGRVGGSLNKPQARGALRLRSPDATPLLQVLAIALPDLSTVLAADATADLSLADGRVGLDGMKGVLAGTSFSGDLGHVGAGASPHLTGHLRVERLGLPTLSALALGPMPLAARDGGWPTVRLAPGLAEIPASSLLLEIGRFDLSDTLFGRDAKVKLGLSPGVVSLDDVTMGLGAGKLDGRLTLRRDGPTASVAGRASFTDQLLPEGPFSGSMSGQLDFTSTGQSFSALAGGLAGNGKVVMNGLTVARADVGALARVVDAADRGGLNFDEAEIQSRLAREFDRDSLALGDRPFDASMAAGVLRLAPQSGNGAPAQFSLAFDVRNMNVDARLALTSPVLPKDWTETPPAATLVWQGRIGGLQRKVEAGPLVNAISARAIAREAARVDALEFDIRERAAFNRRLKAQDFLRRREREVSDFLEQQRAAAEQQRKADEQRAIEEEPPRIADERQRAAKAEAEQLKAARIEEDRARAAKAEEERQKAAKAAADPIGRFLDGPTADDAAKAERDRLDREQRMRRASDILRRRAEEAARSSPAPRVQPPPRIPPLPMSPLADPSTAGRY